MDIQTVPVGVVAPGGNGNACGATGVDDPLQGLFDVLFDQPGSGWGVFQPGTISDTEVEIVPPGAFFDGQGENDVVQDIPGLVEALINGPGLVVVGEFEVHLHCLVWRGDRDAVRRVRMGVDAVDLPHAGHALCAVGVTDVSGCDDIAIDFEILCAFNQRRL